MKLGNLEIPIEISGIVAGSVALIAAFMVLLNMNSILTTPIFLGFVGILFIGTTIAKTLKSKSKPNWGV